MDGIIKREAAGNILTRLSQCRNHLQRENVYSCLRCFTEVLQKMAATRMIPSDEKKVLEEINTFQQNLANSKGFREVYGPVTFRDNDVATTLDFLRQLIEIKEEEIQALLDAKDVPTAGEEGNHPSGNDADSLVRSVQILIENGDYASAREMIAGNEDAMAALTEEYNAYGLKYRRSGLYDEAIQAFKKALVANPHDEGIYYNLACAHISKNAWQDAAEAIGEGLKVNPFFTEGVKLLKYIRERRETK